MAYKHLAEHAHNNPIQSKETRDNAPERKNNKL